MSPVILADQFIRKLIDAGIINEGITHLIIEAKVGDVVKIHTSNIELDDDTLGVVTASVLETTVTGIPADYAESAE